jgi:hypothetical protein
LLEAELNGNEDMNVVVADNVTMGDNAVRALGSQPPMPQPPRPSMLPWVLLAAALAGGVPTTAIATYLMMESNNAETPVELPQSEDTSTTIRFVED